MYIISFILGCSGILLLLVSSAPTSSEVFASAAPTSSEVFKFLSPEDKCIASIRKVIKERKVSRNLGGIVGIGWDALTNEATLPVFSQSYKQCRSTPDGEYLIPDNIVVLPIKEANLHRSSQTFESFSDYKSSVGGSLSVSAGGGIPGIASVSGSMSVETKIGKEHMEKHKQTAFTNSIEYHAFTLIGNEKAGFDEVFTERLNDIANAIKDGNLLLAQYEAESIIGDYGTHVTNKALAGASVTMLSFASSTSTEDKHSFALKFGAEFHASFLGAVEMGMKASADISTSDDEGSSSSETQSYIITKGGPDVNRLLSKNDDNKMMIDSVVGLNRQGMPLYSFIHPKVFKSKKWDDVTTLIVQDFLYNATQEYFRRNTIPGCTDGTSKMYFHRANQDDLNVCNGDAFRTGIFIYGGYYQTCEYIQSYSDAHPNLTHGNQCDEYTHPNPVTNDYSCPSGKLQPMDYSVNFFVTFKHRVHNAKINGCNTTDCSKNYTITDKIYITTHMCVYSDNQPAQLACFGGVFQSENIFTDNKQCARGFDEYPILHNHKICLHIMDGKDDYDVSSCLYFGGFRGCGDNSKCPIGYSRYYLTTMNNCPYYYCVTLPPFIQNNTFLPFVSRPPYVDRDMAFARTRLDFEHEIDKIEDEAADKMLAADGTEIGEIIVA